LFPIYQQSYQYYYQSLTSSDYQSYVSYWTNHFNNNPDDEESYGGSFDDEGGVPSSSGYSDDGSEYSDEYDNSDDSSSGGSSGGSGGSSDDEESSDESDDESESEDKKRDVQQGYSLIFTNYYRPIYLVDVNLVNGTINYSQNALISHLNNGWDYGRNLVVSNNADNYLIDMVYPCWYNSKNVILPGNENLVFFNYDISQREQDFLGYLISGAVLSSLGIIGIIAGFFMICKNA